MVLKRFWWRVGYGVVIVVCYLGTCDESKERGDHGGSICGGGVDVGVAVVVFWVVGGGRRER